ncbi:MAG: alpha/beta hydrolase [Rhizobiaceae bacterium]|nr:alpha/beta hydrolase [Rhizobiaceae bacterium]
MLRRHIENWSDAYTNVTHIPDGQSWPAGWAKKALEFREGQGSQFRAKLNVSYGSSPRNRIDLFLPEQSPLGLVVFVHGGYWLSFDKDHWSHLAAGSLARGYAVAMPSYTLCPDIRIGGIVKEIGAAIEFAAAEVDGPIMLTGHSAGGHLVSRMASATSPLSERTRARIRHVLSISGVHDLRPLMRTGMNEKLRIDEEEAIAESPVLLRPTEGVRLTCWVGGAERSEFLRQNELLANIWAGLGASTVAITEPDRHHFNIIEGLADPNHPLLESLLS